jgi:DNA mismatch endonuclease (patch repair protein)
MKRKPINRSENMSRIKGKDTSIEIRLRKALWEEGIRYRKNCKDIFGRPDICFKGKKVVVFCDSEFWHGKYYLEKKYIPKTNTKYWIEKFKKNIERDKVVNQVLEKEGWAVLRFWEEDINKDLDTCLEKIKSLLGVLEIPCQSDKILSRTDNGRIRI